MSRGTGSSVTINVAALKYSSFTVPVMEKGQRSRSEIFIIYGTGNGKGGTWLL
jgi:hypothetical protein